MSILQRACLTLPTFSAGTYEVGDSVSARAVVLTRVRIAFVLVWMEKKETQKINIS